MKIALIGAGRMASAIVTGLLKQKACKPDDLTCIGSPTDNSAQTLSASTGIRQANTLEELLKGADAAILAFKPQQLATIDPSLVELTSGKLILSILAGKPIAALFEKFPKARNIIRAMPNTPGAIGAGITAWCPKNTLSQEDDTIVTAILNALGKQLQVSEDQLDAITALSGSGPAYVFEFTAALREAGAAVGLEPQVAQTLAIETILGSARLMVESGTDPEELRNQVTSPNGTTYAGLQKLAAHDFRGMIRETIEAAKKRSEELSKP